MSQELRLPQEQIAKPEAGDSCPDAWSELFRQMDLAQGQQEHSRHVHGEQIDNTFAIKRLQHVATDQRVVDTGILVVAQVLQQMLPNVHHFRESRMVSPRLSFVVLCIPLQIQVPQKDKKKLASVTQRFSFPSTHVSLALAWVLGQTSFGGGPS